MSQVVALFISMSVDLCCKQYMMELGVITGIQICSIKDDLSKLL